MINMCKARRSKECVCGRSESNIPSVYTTQALARKEIRTTPFESRIQEKEATKSNYDSSSSSNASKAVVVGTCSNPPHRKRDYILLLIPSAFAYWWTFGGISSVVDSRCRYYPVGLRSGVDVYRRRHVDVSTVGSVRLRWCPESFRYTRCSRTTRLRRGSGLYPSRFVR